MSNSSRSSSPRPSLSDDGIGTSIESVLKIALPPRSRFSKKEIKSLQSAVRKEAHKLETTLREIELIKTRDNNKFSGDRLNAEKSLLSTTRRHCLLPKNLTLVAGSNEDVRLGIGSVTLSNIKLNYCTRSRSEYFLCTFNVKGNSSIFFSEICQTDSRGDINFNVDYTFNNLLNDFEILLTIYVLKVRKQNFARRCLEKISRLFAARRSSVSLFNSWREVTIRIGDVNKTKKVDLGVVNSTLCSLTVCVSAEVDLSNCCQNGWLEISRNGVLWEEKWCVLTGTEIVCYDSPKDTVPKTRVDLVMCKAISFHWRYQALRDQVLKLRVRSLTPDFFIFSNLNGEIHKWRFLQNLVPVLQSWCDAGCFV